MPGFRYLSFIVLFFSTISIFANETYYVLQKTELIANSSLQGGLVLEKIYPGDKVTLLYIEDSPDGLEENIIARIQSSTGKQGYLPFRNLTQKIFIPTTPAVRERFTEKTLYVKADSLYIRSQPDRSAESVAMLSGKDTVTVIAYSEADDYIDGISAKWAHIRAGEDVEGWCFAGYLSESPSTTSGDYAENPDHILRGSQKIVRPRVLHIRDEPGKFGTILGTTGQGSRVRVIERQSEYESLAGVRSIWVKVQSDQVSGWVFGGFLSESGSFPMSSDSIDKPFVVPLASYRRTSGYVNRIHPIKKVKQFHSGIDMGARRGSTIVSAGDGFVERIEDYGKSGYGRLTVIRHENGLVTYYAHQDKIMTKKGESVKAGDPIGEVGSTGASTGPHLHFEVRSGFGGSHYNPDNYVPFPEAKEK